MKTFTNPSLWLKIILLCVALNPVIYPSLSFGQNSKVIVFDIFHGTNPKIADGWQELIPANPATQIVVNSTAIGDSILSTSDALVIFSPVKAIQENEKTAMVKYLREGGSLLLIFDEQRRTPIEVGVNDLILPFGMELTADIAARHNCGAIAENADVCADRRELPYSGGRSIKGGTIISRVNDDGDYIHSAYVKLDAGGKIIVMSDGMAGLLLGRPDGERFSGTGPSDSKYWGKDSPVFMMEILAFLLKE